MGNLNFTTPQVQQRLAQGYYDDIKVAGYTGTKAQLDAILAKAGVVMKAATASANGDAGLVPAPAKGAATRYLRSDGTWQVPPDNNTVYTHPTTAGNKHIPAGGISGQILRWSADGTATWGEETTGSGGNDFFEITAIINAEGSITIPTGTYASLTNATLEGKLMRLTIDEGERGKMAMIANFYPTGVENVVAIMSISGDMLLFFSITSSDTMEMLGRMSYLTSGDVVDSLTSQSDVKALSANQGRILNEKIRVATNAPANSVGSNGDIWIQYTP